MFVTSYVIYFLNGHHFNAEIKLLKEIDKKMKRRKI